MRYGYWRVHVVLIREGWDVSIRLVYNVYRAPGLQLRNKSPKRRVRAKLRDDRAEAVGLFSRRMGMTSWLWERS